MKKALLTLSLFALIVSVNAQVFYAKKSTPEKKEEKNDFTEISGIHPFPKDALSTDNYIYLDFFGSGDIQKSISEGKDINANTGLGVLFERYAGKDNVIQSFELEGVINIATTADTIKSEINNSVYENQRDFGTYILNPVSAKQSLFINGNIYFGEHKNSDDEFSHFGNIAKVISGVNFRVVSSNNTWQYDTLTTNLGAMSFRAGIFHEFVPNNYRLAKDEYRSKYSIFLGLNYSFRGIFGDITSDSKDELRNKILGTNQKSFHGIEANFGFRLNNLRAEFQMPVLREREGSIEGLTNTQFLFSIKFIGGFPLKLDKTDDDTREENVTR